MHCRDKVQYIQWFAEKGNNELFLNYCAGLG
jgi:hypothetical protein